MTTPTSTEPHSALASGEHPSREAREIIHEIADMFPASGPEVGFTPFEVWYLRLWRALRSRNGEVADPVVCEREACAYLAETHTGMWDNATAENIAAAIRERGTELDDTVLVFKDAWAKVQPVWMLLRHGVPLPADLAQAIEARRAETQSGSVHESAVTGSAGQAPPSNPLPEEENRTRDDLREALEEINHIRNSIIGLQTMNWSEHVYPLVAALDAAGFEGMEYPEARENFGTMLERTNAAEKALTDALSRLSALQERAERAEKALADERVVSARLTAWTDGYGGVDLTLAGGRRIALALGPPHEASAPGKSA